MTNWSSMPIVLRPGQSSIQLGSEVLKTLYTPDLFLDDEPNEIVIELIGKVFE